MTAEYAATLCCILYACLYRVPGQSMVWDLCYILYAFFPKSAWPVNGLDFMRSIYSCLCQYLEIHYTEEKCDQSDLVSKVSLITPNQRIGILSRSIWGVICNQFLNGSWNKYLIQISDNCDGNFLGTLYINAYNVFLFLFLIIW